MTDAKRFLLPVRRGCAALLMLAAGMPVHAAPPAFAAVIQREVPALMASAHIKGVAVGLIVDGKLVYTQGFGFSDHAGTVPATPDTVFTVASLSKPVAAWVAMSLVEQGKLKLDQPVAELVQPWPLADSRFDHRAITWRHLLSHTAGTTLGGYQGWLTREELPTLEQSLAGKTNGRGAVELMAPAGARFQYSGGGYTLMQLAIERSMKRKYEELAAELVFKPLSMKHSSVSQSPQQLAGSAQGHGDDGLPVPMRFYAEQAPSTLSTTVTDFSRWMLAGMQQADGDASGPLPWARLAEMYEPAPLSSPRAPGEMRYGLGFFTERLPDGSLAVGHDGRNQAGFRANFSMRPQGRDGIVILSNARTGLALDRVICLWQADASKSDPATFCKK